MCQQAGGWDPAPPQVLAPVLAHSGPRSGVHAEIVEDVVDVAAVVLEEGACLGLGLGLGLG